MILYSIFYYIEEKENKHTADMTITALLGAIDVSLAWVMYEAVVKVNVERVHSLVTIGIVFWFIGAALFMVHQYDHDDGNILGSWIVIIVEFFVMMVWAWSCLIYISCTKRLILNGAKIMEK